MNFLPFVFYDELLFITSAIFGFNAKYKKLEGAFGLCASELEEKQHFATFNITAEEPEDKIENPEILVDKYKLYNEVEMEFDRPLSAYDKSSLERLQEFVKQPGLLRLNLLHLCVDISWIDLFLSWKNIKVLLLPSCYTLDTYEPVERLLKMIQESEQLLSLHISQGGFYSAEQKLYCDFLIQPQFQVLFILNGEASMRDAVMHTWYNNKKQLAGKTVVWLQEVMLHNQSFKKIGRLQPDSLRFKKGSLIVDYYNKNATSSMKSQEFMDGVGRCELRFSNLKSTSTFSKFKFLWTCFH
ncbi:hypothetical protein L596_017554 [Steinernema carpocapsae]|uniref:Uncharacterized protein n=1 Tax=Steinernema carpocapsae TaxID=34508 RepID=A0A4U5N2Q6_STECR|nr:hypothetical protein L596_017554 [Steinernema carpocapsae]